VLLPRAKSCGDWTDDLIKPWGKMARAAINKKPADLADLADCFLNHESHEYFCPADLAEVTGKQHKNVMQAIRNMEPAWEKICGRKFALTSRTISMPNGGTRKITQGKFYLSTYKDPTGRTLPCYTITEVAMMLNTQI